MVDVILVSVTLVSLALAAVMGLITWRVLRQERRRTDARIADLAAASMTDDEPVAEPVPAARQAAPPRAGTWPPPAGRARCVEAAASAPADPLWTDLVLDRTSAPSAGGHGAATRDLFTVPEPITSDGRRLMMAVGLGSAALLAAFAVVLATTPRPAQQATLSPAAARVAAPLELVSLDHARAGVRLSIHGTVRNPVAGSPVRGVTAVVFLFDRAGGYLGTVEAPLVDAELQPGRASSFDVPVEAGQPVARYRVTFRVSTRPVPHVDRRAPAAPAAPATTRAAVVRQASLSETAAGGR